MADIAGWIALVATCIAALLTAANLGARPTGWGFVIFTVGAIAWVVVGLSTGQTQLLYSNIFLGLVDLFGVWRWLGHRAKVGDTLQAEEARSRDRSGEGLFSLSGLEGMAVHGADGQVIARAVDGLAACAGGQIAYLVVRHGGVGGVGETLRRLAWAEVRVDDQALHTDLDEARIAALPLADARA